MFDIEAVRAEFPALRQELYGHPLLYFDNAATMQMPEPVLDAVERHYHGGTGNVHRGIHTLSERSTSAFEDARQAVASFINAASADEVIFTSGTTASINLLADLWGASLAEPAKAGTAAGNVLVLEGGIAVTMMEHHANFVPWQQLCHGSGREFFAVGLDSHGNIDLGQLERLLAEEKVALVAITQVSNVLGTVNPVKRVAEMAHERGALVLVDAAQSIRHGIVDVQEIGCDFLAFSGHKICGPTGIGVLYGRTELLERFAPVRFGGEMVQDVRVESTTFADLPIRLEAGTPNYVGAIGLAAALEYLTRIGLDDIACYERGLIGHIERGLGGIEGIRVLGSPRDRLGCVSFTVDGVHPFDLAMLADKLGLALRSGNQCAQPLLYEVYDVGNVARMSPAFYNTHEEIDQALEIVERVVALLRAKSVPGGITLPVHEANLPADAAPFGEALQSEQAHFAVSDGAMPGSKSETPRGAGLSSDEVALSSEGASPASPVKAGGEAAGESAGLQVYEAVERPTEFRWEWIQYPHGNQELVERTTDACLEQMPNDREGRPQFLLSLRNADNSQNHWAIVLDADDGDVNWFETLKARANEILAAPEEFEQCSL